ncbi:6-phosphofructo-2-kinase-domain-containing protein [Lineolata rhizophorae]|uniref:6-phosphofructo-2-kinase-domain-containing protein n=1 Tax=Lineolata rhizophorae TaxID=578093 RepID=A0A6A6PDS5_9PEZI|nr:6-phosphofructo-2-kinase-domain-containing protein [Lineolata rhizophorae]
MRLSRKSARKCDQRRNSQHFSTIEASVALKGRYIALPASAGHGQNGYIAVCTSTFLTCRAICFRISSSILICCHGYVLLSLFPGLCFRKGPRQRKRDAGNKYLSIPLYGDLCRTADVAVTAPRFRRRSSIFEDAIHDLPEKEEMAPAQLYSTESGRLFHSGRIVIVTVGLPARGKTHISVAIARYLRWLGVKTHVFHLGDYRRATVGEGKDVPDDYFFVNASPSSVLLRNKILKRCREDIYHFLEHENGQVAIYDAVNAISTGRKALAKEFAKHQVQTLFIESQCNDERIIEENVRSVKISSPDYTDWKDEDAVRDYLARIAARIPHFETMEEPDLHWIKLINAGERVLVNNCAFGYLSQRIVFYLLNLHIKSRRTYFVRAGTTKEDESYKADASLSEEGQDYARKMSEQLIAHREAERQALIDCGGPKDTALKPLTIWTSTRRRTVETAEYLNKLGYRTRQRSQLSQLNPGVCEKMSERRIREEYPEEVAKHEQDPYHHRYPRAESYHDLAVRLEPIILELEREQNDLLIIAHESVLRVLYGYLMACNANDIPRLDFPRNEIIEIIPASYNNVAKRIHIPDVPDAILPASPEDIRIPVPPSGNLSPFSGLGSPVPSGVATPSGQPIPTPIITIGSGPGSAGSTSTSGSAGTSRPIDQTVLRAVAADANNSGTRSPGSVSVRESRSGSGGSMSAASATAAIMAAGGASPALQPQHSNEAPPLQQQEQQHAQGEGQAQARPPGTGKGSEGASQGRATPQPLGLLKTHVNPSS